jgi:hypothetical protein
MISWKEAMNEFVQFLKNIWKSVRSNPFFVAGSSAAGGAITSCLQDELASGHIDWTRGGLNKLTGLAVTVAVAGIVHLYRTPPGVNPTPK